MSYSTKINSNQINVGWKTLQTFFDALGVRAYGNVGSDDLTVYSQENNPTAWRTNSDYNNYNPVINGTTYTIKNTSAGDPNYNVYDLIATAKAAGIPNAKIADALKASKVKVPEGYDKWDNNTVKSLNVSTTAGTAQIQEYLDKYYPNAGAYVSVIMNTNGNGYKTRVVYTHPTTGAKVYTDIDGIGSDALSEKKLSDLIGPTTNLGNALTTADTHYGQQSANTEENAKGQIAAGKGVLEALGYKLNEDGSATLVNSGIGTSVKTNHTLTPEQVKSLETALPSTTDLKAWNKGNELDIYNTIYNNLNQNSEDPKALGANTKAALDAIQGLSDIIAGNQVDTTQRSINNQQQQLLQQIRNDPALYEAITKQLRADNAAGTIAGQRAANAQQLAGQSDASYDETASKLYSQLFTGETAVADATRNNLFKERAGSLSTVQQGALNDLEAAARKQTSAESDALQRFADTYSTALDVDTSKYNNAIELQQSITSGNASTIVSDIEKTVKQQIAANDGLLKNISDKLNISKDYLQSALNGQADVTPALQAILGRLTAQVATSGATVVNPQLVDEAVQFANKHYDDFVASDAFKYYLSDEGMNALTTTKDINALLEEYGLTDVLTQEGIKSLYEGYAKEANTQSDKVFNAAQRAYIAAVTAGDTKTTEQLTKLAASAGVSKRNLYTASALANQFKQQFGLNNTGRQLATDFQNQQAANNSMLATAGKNAFENFTAIKGDGSDEYGKGTLSAIEGLIASAKQANKNIYSNIANQHMAATQGTNGKLGLNTSNVNSVIADNNRKTEVGAAISGLNTTAATNNITNQYVKDTTATDALAQIAQGNSTLNTLNTNKSKTKTK